MTAKFADVAALRKNIVSRIDPAYAARMLQPIPVDIPTVKDRGAWLCDRAKGLVVLDIGCTGPISDKVRAVAKQYFGFDKAADAAKGIEAVELDHRPDLMPKHESVELVICSEVLEHLSNPGYFLLALKEFYPKRPIIFTVPNAGSYLVKDGFEIVNAEHVCWYSYATLRSLLMRYDYEIKESRWMNGPPYKAETVAMVTEA